MNIWCCRAFGLVKNPPRPPGLRACRLSGFCPPYPPPLLLFSKVLHTNPRFARFPTSVLTWHHQDAFKTASKPRTDLRTRPSAAKCLQELDFDVQKSLAPPKSVENCEKPKKNEKKSKKNRKKKFGAKKSKVANLPKRVLPKFRADRSHVRRVRGRLGGIREA